MSVEAFAAFPTAWLLFGQHAK